MTDRIDLNADLGEGFGAWRMGADAELLDIVTSANIACGFHAGDPDIMAATMARAVTRGVALGAHPGLPDLQGFGRRRMQLTPIEASHLVAYQVGAAAGMARLAGGRLRHLKLHGALANMAAEDEALARACFEGALGAVPDLIVIAIAASAQQQAAQAMGIPFAAEVFADRGYAEDGMLMDRRLPGAVLHDPTQISERVVQMIRAQAIRTASGIWLPCQIDTICIHGDTEKATVVARALQEHLHASGIRLVAFGAACSQRDTGLGA